MSVNTVNVQSQDIRIIPSRFNIYCPAHHQVKRESFEIDLILSCSSFSITDSKPEWPWGCAPRKLTAVNRAEIWEQSDKVSGWQILAPARPHRSATMRSDKRKGQIDCCFNWLRQHRSTWVYSCLRSQTNCCQSSLSTLLHHRSLNKLTEASCAI